MWKVSVFQFAEVTCFLRSNKQLKKQALDFKSKVCGFKPSVFVRPNFFLDTKRHIVKNTSLIIRFEKTHCFYVEMHLPILANFRRL
jgi:hypothetical protein